MVGVRFFLPAFTQRHVSSTIGFILHDTKVVHCRAFRACRACPAVYHAGSGRLADSGIELGNHRTRFDPILECSSAQLAGRSGGDPSNGCHAIHGYSLGPGGASISTGSGFDDQFHVPLSLCVGRRSDPYDAGTRFSQRPRSRQPASIGFLAGKGRRSHGGQSISESTRAQ